MTFCTARALSSANVPSQLEPTGLDRADGKHLGGITLVPWSNGRSLVWDATCVDTFGPSHLSSSASEVCAAANQAEQTKIKKYSYITSHAHTLLSHLLPWKLLESAALAPCLSCQTWVAATLVTKAPWHTSCISVAIQKNSASICF